MKIEFTRNCDIEIFPESEIEDFALNSFLANYYKKNSKITIYQDICKTIKTEIQYNKKG